MHLFLDRHCGPLFIFLDYIKNPVDIEQIMNIVRPVPEFMLLPHLGDNRTIKKSTYTRWEPYWSVAEIPSMSRSSFSLFLRSKKGRKLKSSPTSINCWIESRSVAKSGSRIRGTPSGDLA